MNASNPYQSPESSGSPELNHPPTSSGDFGAAPTNVRFGVLGFAFSMSVLLYLHRYALSIAGLPMMTELGLDEKDFGVATGAFFYTYALAQVPAGWLSDRLGGRLTLGAYVVLWSFALGGTGFITGLTSLVVFRGLLGLAQAGAYPCIASVIKRWFPVQRRGVANSVTSMGGRAGALLNTLITVSLMAVIGRLFSLQQGEWRYLFVLYATLGFVWAGLFWWWFRNSPSEHASCNAAEREFIEHGTPAVSRPKSIWETLPPFVPMAKCPTVYVLSVVSVCVNIGWIFLVTFLTVFLKEHHGFSLKAVGLLSALPIIAGMCGGVAGGVATDTLARRFGVKWGRRLTGIIASGGAAIVYVGCLVSDNPIIHIASFAAAGFLIDFGLGSLWAVYQDIAGKHVAAVLGFGNMCGNLAAGYFATIIGAYAKAHDWTTVFAISSGALVVTACGWLFVNPEKPLEEKE